MNNAEKPPIINRKIPYEVLTDREFEELLYSIGKNRLKNDDWKGLYDDISLPPKTRDEGADCLLLKDGLYKGVIQCKHTTTKRNRVSRPESAREIIKFVLHYLLNPKLINDVNDFTYYFVSSSDFTREAIRLLDDSKNEIIEDDNFQTWVTTVIASNKGFKDFTFEGVKERLVEVFVCLQTNVYQGQLKLSHRFSLCN